MPRITIIEPTINPLTRASIFTKVKRRVAAYARVSTKEEEQEYSYEAQKQYYEDYIAKHEDWEFVNIYADEGLSGTNMKKRKQFMQMIEDAKAGKIDLILTKSISRFARNTLDTIQTVRDLKANHVEVFFETHNISTFESTSELLMTIMASIAQEESRNISQNVTWGKRAGFQKGKVSIPFGQFLGYKKGENGEIEIDETEAPKVREIYRLFLIEGLTPHSIAERFNRLGMLTVKNKKWSKNGVLSILTNEKYKGDAELQKGYVENFLDHKVVKNNGVLPKYYVENSHKAIIDRAEWDMVQAEIERRNKIGLAYSAKDIFSAKLICEHCGSFYGRKVWHSTDDYRRIIYQCNHKFENSCETPHLTEKEIIDKFLLAYNKVMTNKDRVVEDLIELAEVIGNYDDIDTSIEETKTELQELEALVKVLFDERGKSNDVSDEEFLKKYNSYEGRHKTAKAKLDKLRKDKDIKKGKHDHLIAIAEALKNEPNKILKWDKKAWVMTVESAIVHYDKTITFKFYDGREVRV